MLQNTPPPSVDENELKERTKRLCVKEGAAWSVMDGFGGQYITPYALAIGATNTQIGFLMSLPSLIGSLSQLLTLKAMRRYSRKAITMAGVAVQAVCFLPVIGIGALYFTFGVRSAMPAWALIAVYTLLVMAGTFGGPSWNSWMKDIVEKDLGSFFGRRSRIVGAVGLVSLLLAGFLLDFFKGTNLFLGFTILFFIAFLGRSVSVYLLGKQWEPPFKSDDAAFFTFLQFLRRMAHNNFGRFTLFVSLYSFATQISSPFIAVYMLKDLGFSYTQYMIVNLSAAVTAMLVLPTMGRFSDRYGCQWLIRACCWWMSLIPVLWFAVIFFQRAGAPVPVIHVYLCATQVFAGAVWAGFGLAVGNFIFDAVTRQRMAICVSYFSILSGVGNLAGAAIGGWCSSLSFVCFGVPAISFIFLLSGAARYAVCIVFSGRIREVRPVAVFTVRDSQEKIIGPSLRHYYMTFKSNVFRRFPPWGV